MSDELVPRKRPDSSLAQRQARIFGSDLYRAKGYLEQAHEAIEAGSISRAGTILRRAAVALEEPSRMNDKALKRERLDIVNEVCEFFDPDFRYPPEGAPVIANRECIKEVMHRLGCSQADAIQAIYDWRGRTETYSLPEGKQIEPPPQKTLPE